MKKKLLLLLSLVAMITVLFAISVSAEEFTISSEHIESITPAGIENGQRGDVYQMFDGNINCAGGWYPANGWAGPTGSSATVVFANEYSINSVIFYGWSNWNGFSVTFYDAEGTETAKYFNGGYQVMDGSPTDLEITGIEAKTMVIKTESAKGVGNMSFTEFVIEADTTTSDVSWDISATEEDNVFAYLYKDLENEGMYTMEIKGTGNMLDWTVDALAPWNDLYGKSISSVIIGNGVINIGGGAFYQCSALESVDLSQAPSLKEIDMAAFMFCSSLTDVNLGNTVETINHGAFDSCTALKKIFIPKSVTFVGYDPFHDCGALTIYLENGVIPGNWYYGWDYLDYGRMCQIPVVYGHTHAYTYVSDSVSHTGSCECGITVAKEHNYVNHKCICGADEPYVEMWDISATENDNVTATLYEDLENEGMYSLVIKGSGNMKIWSASHAPWYASYKPTVKSVTIENGVTNIGQNAFYGCTNIVSIAIPDSVTIVDNSAFLGCTSLTSVNIPNSVTGIGSSAFANCSSLTSINIPQGVTSIEVNTFTGCQSLTSVNISESVISVGAWAFEFCSSLTSINIPNGVTIIGYGAFSGCSNLTSINISNNVTSIGNSAFQDCSSLTIYCEAASQPEGWGANWNCSNCPVVWGHTTHTPVNNLVNNGDTHTGNCVCGVTVTEEHVYEDYLCACGAETYVEKWDISKSSSDSVTALLYKDRENEGMYSLVIKGKGEMEDWYSNLNAPWYSYAAKIASVTIEESVKSISSCAFYGCSSLASINIPEGITYIGGSAFSGCQGLTSINIPEGITSIYSSTFYGCQSLTSITIPEGVTSIGIQAFEGCSKLASVNIPQGLTSIGYKAFYDCQSLTSVTIPESVTSIDDFAFYGCQSLASVNIPEGVTSIGQSTFYGCQSLTSITIPESVTSIGSYAFYNCSSLTSINIPESVTSIGEGAFRNCSGLTSITIPESVTSIGNSAFSGCSMLTSVTIPQGVTSIGDSAFRNCSGLTSVTIPKGVTSIGQSTFYGCQSLASVDIPEGVTSIGSQAFWGCKSLTSVIIPDGVTSIGDFAFSSCKNLTSVIIPKGVTSIGDSAFSSCSNLTSVIIPEGVTSIGDSAFYNCSSLTSITIPESVTSIKKDAFLVCSKLTIYCEAQSQPEGWDEDWNCSNRPVVWGHTHTATNSLVNKGDTHTGTCVCGVTVTEEHVYEDYLCDCGAETYVEKWDISKSSSDSVTATLYEGLENEGMYILVIKGSGNMMDWTTYYSVPWYSSYAKLIKTVTIEDGVTSIGNNTFFGLQSLTDVTIPEGVTSIGDSAFSGCKSLTSIVLPNSVETMGGGAFSACSKLESITMPSGLTSVKYDAFYNSSALKRVYISDAEAWCKIDFATRYSNPLYYARNLYLDGELLTEAIIPEGVTKLGYAFYNCNSIEYVSIPKSLTEIGSDAFYGCSNLMEVYISDLDAWCRISFANQYSNPVVFTKNLYLNDVPVTSVVVPSDVTSLKYTFYNCSSLKNVVISEGVTALDSYAFYGCTSLTGISVPASIKSMKQTAFTNCTALTRVDITDLDAWCRITFNDLTANPLYYAKKLYLNGSLVTKVTLPSDISSISYTFASCQDLASVTIPSNITSIGVYSFYGCTGLTKVVIPDTVTSMGAFVFRGCTGLTDVTLPNGLETISMGMFKGCTSLASITIPSSVTAIESETFYDCTALTEVVIPNGVTRIANHTFYGCTSLASINIPETITRIGSCAFEGCTSLASITIPSSVTAISNYAFNKCTSLKVVYIDSEAVASALTAKSACGYLIGYAETVLVRTGISTTGSYVTNGEIFNYFSNVSLYDKDYGAYSKHLHIGEENCDIFVITEPSCSAQGLQELVCKTCGMVKTMNIPTLAHTNGEIIPAINPTPTVTGYTQGYLCSVCGGVAVEPQAVTVTDVLKGNGFEFKAISLSISKNISIDYKAIVPEGYTNVYAVFKLGNFAETVVADYTIEDGRYVFNFNGTRIHLMNENIVAYVYGINKNGEYERFVYSNYSVVTYCVNQLKKSTISASLRTAISDLLVLGAETQKYLNPNVSADELPTTIVKNLGYTLTPSTFTTIPDTCNKQLMSGTRINTTDWRAVSLMLGEQTLVQLKFISDNIENVTVKVFVPTALNPNKSVEYEYGYEDFIYDEEIDRYVLEFEQLSAIQYDTALTAKLYVNGEEIGRTLQYSINTYLWKNYNSLDVAKALYLYGESIKAYAGK